MHTKQEEQHEICEHFSTCSNVNNHNDNYTKFNIKQIRRNTLNKLDNWKKLLFKEVSLIRSHKLS